MESLLPDIGSLGTVGVYVLLSVLVFVESGLLVGFLLPGDTVLFAAGLLAGDPGEVSVEVLVGLVLVAAVAGDALGYASGRRLGRPWLERRVSNGRLDVRHLERAERFFTRYGWWSVVIARWIPWVRTFTPMLAGASGMPYPRFVAANIVGALSWAVTLVLLGFVAAGNPWVRDAAIAVAVSSVTLSLLAALLARRRRR